MNLELTGLLHHPHQKKCFETPLPHPKHSIALTYELPKQWAAGVHKHVYFAGRSKDLLSFDMVAIGYRHAYEPQQPMAQATDSEHTFSKSSQQGNVDVIVWSLLQSTSRQLYGHWNLVLFFADVVFFACLLYNIHL